MIVFRPLPTEQLGAIVYHWGRRHSHNLKLGYVLADGRTFFVGTPDDHQNPLTIWISSNNQGGVSGEFGPLDDDELPLEDESGSELDYSHAHYTILDTVESYSGTPGCTNRAASTPQTLHFRELVTQMVTRYKAFVDNIDYKAFISLSGEEKPINIPQY